MRKNFADTAPPATQLSTLNSQPPPGLGTRLSRAIVKATGKQPCGTCRQIRDGIDRVEQVIRQQLKT